MKHGAKSLKFDSASIMYANVNASRNKIFSELFDMGSPQQILLEKLYFAPCLPCENARRGGVRTSQNFWW